MATKTFEELKQMAIQIRDEKTNKQNTATRIGTQMLEHLNKLEQDFLDKDTTEGKFSELEKEILSIPTIQSDLYTDIKNISSSSVSIPIVDKNGNILSQIDTFNWVTTEIDKVYHVIGDINLINNQSIIVSWSAPPSIDTYIDNYDSYLTKGIYHIDTVIKAKGERLSVSNGLVIYECERKTDEIHKEIEEINKGIRDIVYEKTYSDSVNVHKLLVIPYSFKKNTGYCLKITNISANSNIRLFTTNETGIGFDDCVQYIGDIEPIDQDVYFYTDEDAGYLFIQIINSTDTNVGFNVKLLYNSIISEIAKSIYLLKLDKNNFTNTNIAKLVEESFNLGDIISLWQDVRVINFENGQIRPRSDKQWGKISTNTDYYIKGVINLERAENLLALFDGAASADTIIDDFSSYTQKGIYNVSFIFNSGNATRISLAKGLVLQQLMDLKSHDDILEEKTIIDHLVTPSAGLSETTWRGAFSLIPKGSIISEFSFSPRFADGKSVCALFEFNDINKEIIKREEFIVEATQSEFPEHISYLEGKITEYDTFILFKKNNTDNDAIGWIDDGTGALLGVPASIGDTISVRDNNLAGSIGNLCLKIVYKSNLFIKNEIHVGKGFPFESLSVATFAASHGDSIIVHPGHYKNQNIQSWGKKIHIVGMNKYSCVLECDTGDYLNPPIEMNIGSICNMTVNETCANPTVTDEQKTSAGYDRKNMAYTIHIESGIMASGEILHIDNCILKNKHRSCIGAGLYQDYGVSITNSYCYSGMGYVNTVSGANGSRGALYFHSKSDDSNTTGQTFNAENCVFECEDEKCATINAYYNNIMELRFIKNTFHSAAKVVETNVSQWSEDAIIKLNPISQGNNIAKFNF